MRPDWAGAEPVKQVKPTSWRGLTREVGIGAKQRARSKHRSSNAAAAAAASVACLTLTLRGLACRAARLSGCPPQQSNCCSPRCCIMDKENMVHLLPCVSSTFTGTLYSLFLTLANLEQLAVL